MNIADKMTKNGSRANSGEKAGSRANSGEKARSRRGGSTEDQNKTFVWEPIDWSAGSRGGGSTEDESFVLKPMNWSISKEEKNLTSAKYRIGNISISMRDVLEKFRVSLCKGRYYISYYAKNCEIDEDALVLLFRISQLVAGGWSQKERDVLVLWKYLLRIFPEQVTVTLDFLLKNGRIRRLLEERSTSPDFFRGKTIQDFLHNFSSGGMGELLSKMCADPELRASIDKKLCPGSDS